jgi:hypothetical protein
MNLICDSRAYFKEEETSGHPTFLFLGRELERPYDPGGYGGFFSFKVSLIYTSAEMSIFGNWMQDGASGVLFHDGGIIYGETPGGYQKVYETCYHNVVGFSLHLYLRKS